MVVTSSREGNVHPTIVGAGPSSPAKGLGMGKSQRMVSLSRLKPRVSVNLDGRCRGANRGMQDKRDITNGATHASDRLIAIGKKTRSGAKVANEVTRAMNVPQAAGQGRCQASQQGPHKPKMQDGCQHQEFR